MLLFTSFNGLFTLSESHFITEMRSKSPSNLKIDCMNGRSTRSIGRGSGCWAVP